MYLIFYKENNEIGSSYISFRIFHLLSFVVSGAKNKSESLLQIDDDQSSGLSSRKPEEKDKLIQQPNVLPPENQAVQHEHLLSISQASDSLVTKESSNLTNVYLLDRQNQGYYILT